MSEATPKRIAWVATAGLFALAIAGLAAWTVSKRLGKDDPALWTRPAARSDEGTSKTPPGNRRRIYDAFPPLTRFGVDSAVEAGSGLDDGESILGVEVEGQARAYPLNMLGQPGSEVVNDVLGGRLIAVTFCGLCETPLVFSRLVGGRTLTFRVSGELYDSNMLIEDVETRSGWVQILGKAIDGPLRGTTLERLPVTWTDWKTWKAGHPGTTVIHLTRGTRKYSADPPGSTPSKKRAFREALQWGLAEGEEARSWPFSGLAARRVVNDAFAGRPLLLVFDPDWPAPIAFERKVDGRELVFRKDNGGGLVDDATSSNWEATTGLAVRGPLAGHRLDPVAGTIAATAVWRTFHPRSETWSPGIKDSRP